ncbi:ArsR family transcriptional regulator [Paenibacillus darwinianus]|uniref:ArsR family transcriptional regulator n=1 Tax=Paenibacillus darwinianus TaxID=1380763 RepID=A0A9W5W8A7_9BACL|nr:helix-turn-helix domain-containing protein [Paenibacillus darwinianus]EXX90390.1 ArsR family transcriptional regulator [Paenibacillus darwinianus]EXX91090.1 ArsR family transcriptional regulator [Paenibacillus darwinianus]EXX91968.1 ArsR family transcriptional regulator [Paenibacillus darwinianus]
MTDINRQDTIRYPASRILDVAKALSGDVRVRILEALGNQPMSINQLAEALGVAQPTISINVQTLEQAELVVSTQGANREKICSVTCRSILLELPAKPGEGLHQIEEIHMPIGMYSQCSIRPPCGMINRDGMLIGSQDDPRVFYMPERTEAALLWFAEAGYVEYYFANPLPPGVKLEELRIRAELCSEAVAFREDWPSDISLTINDKPIGTWTSPADFGDRKGKLTPERWKGGTEYGMLTEWHVTREGSRVNDRLSAPTTIDALDLAFNKPIRVRFEVREDAVNKRGLNLFGSSFGDHPQDIVLSFIRSTTE